MAHYEPPHLDLRCLQIQLFSSLVLKKKRIKAYPFCSEYRREMEIYHTISSQSAQSAGRSRHLEFPYELTGLFPCHETKMKTKRVQLLKKGICSTGSKLFPLRVSPFSSVLSFWETNRKSQKLPTCVKWKPHKSQRTLT